MNKARGEAGLKAGGKTLALALNLGALADLEEAFSAQSFEDVITDVLDREKMSASKLRLFFNTVAESNGHDIADQIGAMMPDDMQALAVELTSRAFPDPKPGKKANTKNP